MKSMTFFWINIFQLFFIFIELKSLPALAYSSGDTTIIESGKANYSLLNRKFIFDQAERKIDRGKDFQATASTMKSLKLLSKPAYKEKKSQQISSTPVSSEKLEVNAKIIH